LSPELAEYEGVMLIIRPGLPVVVEDYLFNREFPKLKQ
jgi:hypothetical protein